MPYIPSPTRYQSMRYNRCGRSGLKLPAISLGLWHNFGFDKSIDSMRAICRTAFDLGVTHFDLANNYGPPPGSAEISFGDILRSDFRGLRDEVVISTKAGYEMWSGPYGEWGSRKYLLASLDQSLKRLGLEYVDIFYSHRFDPATPLEETMGALDAAVRQGKALYAGISSYNSRRTKEAAAILKRLGTPCLIHQPSYSLINRWIEDDRLLETLEKEGIGAIAFSPLAQGLLTDKYLAGVPAGSRATVGDFFQQDDADDGECRACAPSRLDRQAAGPVAGSDGSRVGSQGQAGDLGADRRQPPGAGRGRRQGARASGLHRRGTQGDRSLRGRGRGQSVAAVGGTRPIGGVRTRPTCSPATTAGRTTATPILGSATMFSRC